MDETSQSDAIEFLHRVCSEAGDNTPPALTHISRVFFADARVFKLKRAVLKPYLDFSSPELRCKACARELELNRRTAQSLYIALRRITREPAGLVFEAQCAGLRGDQLHGVVATLPVDDRRATVFCHLPNLNPSIEITVEYARGEFQGRMMCAVWLARSP